MPDPEQHVIVELTADPAAFIDALARLAAVTRGFDAAFRTRAWRRGRRYWREDPARSAMHAAYDRRRRARRARARRTYRARGRR